MAKATAAVSPLRRRMLEAVEFATLEWVDWFNHRRLLEPIGSIPPAEAEANFYAVLEQPAMAA
jgi:transposase InsO family protein